MEATVCAVATGTPDGGVAIVRVSGPRAAEIGRVLLGVLPTKRRLSARVLTAEAGAAAGERALAVWMPGPGSYTGEDVLELHVHAGIRNVRSVVDAILALGARTAAPGEFTRRAFLHGRLDLSEAEGIAAVIGAQTEEALAQARRLVAGELGHEVEILLSSLGDLRAEIEANLDFPEEVAVTDVERWQAEIASVTAVVGGWVARFERGRRARERARIVIAGPPNAGKSALFNALLGKGRAIVSDVPGTTRDYVEAELSLGGHQALLVDTAGIRAGSDALEVAGIELGRQQLVAAELVVWVEGADQEPLGAGPAEAGREGTWIAVENKRDLGVRRSRWLGVSATSGEGLQALREHLEASLGVGGEPGWIGLVRHRDRALEAREALEEASRELAGEPSLEIVAFHLGVAASRLAEITGRSTLGPVGAEVLERIFSRFCIGK